ncbi:GIY-YIG nuclease family protein [Spirosoma radiotolerans]|uniref:Uncharacterized protein n=1 Tax=Spirosoma radiotolerans TaxID=1379870 RepID=A0A0E3ZVF4_9BACT|nr:GIY-YIG nuclease family protein [Spirosoma radiotolerans]AKD55015.1 hypothetical protein SD10_08975 [Spirosoma radiotolerans]
METNRANKPRPLITGIKPIRLPLPIHLDLYKLWSRRIVAKGMANIGCGLYYLFNESGELQYVGQSAHIKGRIMTHLKRADMDFTYVTILKVRDESLWDKIEREAIEHFLPPFNKRYNGGYHSRPSGLK